MVSFRYVIANTLHKDDKKVNNNMLMYFSGSGPGSVVGIAIGYGLNGPGIKSWWKRDFPHPSKSALGPTQPPAQWVSGLSLG
jgi:hypothetical protein